MREHSHISVEALYAFANRDYPKCCDIVLVVFPKVTVLLCQLMLISLQRLGRESSIRIFESEHLPHLEAYPWESQLVKLTLERVDPAVVAEQARTAEQKAEFHCYYGSLLLTRGDVSGAHREFERCLEIPGQFVEQRLAWVQLQWESPVARDQQVREQLAALNQQAEQLREQGQSENALEVQRQAYLLAQALSEADPLRLRMANNLGWLEWAADNLEEAEAVCREAFRLHDMVAYGAAADIPMTYTIQGLIHRRRGDPATCVEYLLHAVDLRREMVGEEDPDIPKLFRFLAETYTAVGDVNAAGSALRQALGLTLQHSNDALSTLQVFNELADHLFQHGSAEEAEEASRRCLEAALAGFPEDTPAVTRARSRLAVVLGRRGDWDGARHLYERLLETLSSTLGEETPEYLACLWDYAANRRSAGEEVSASALLTRFLALQRTDGSGEDAEEARRLFQRALAYVHLGNLSQAIAPAQRALELWNGLPEDHADAITQTHQLLANCHRELGEHGYALPHLRALAARFSDPISPPSREYAKALLQLGICLAELHKHDEAVEHLRKSLGLIRKAVGEKSPESVLILNALAVAVRGSSRGWQETPRRYLEEALECVGNDGPARAMIIHNLADELLHEGDFSGAVRLLEPLVIARRSEAQEISTEELTLLVQLGLAHYFAGEFASAESRLREALDAGQHQWSEADPIRARAVEVLAAVCAAMGRPGDALDLLLESERSRELGLGGVLATATEQERFRYMRYVHASTGALLMLLCDHDAPQPDVVATVWEIVTRRRSLAREAMGLQRGAGASQTRAVDGEVRQLRDRLAALEMQGPPVGQEAFDVWHKTIQEIRQRIRGFEESLADRVSASVEEIRSLNANRLSAALPRDSVLVEFVKFQGYEFDRREALPDAGRRPEQYCAFLLRPGYSPGVVSLGPAAPIDEAVAVLGGRASDSEERGHWPWESDPSSGAEADGPVATLSELVLAPLLPWFELGVTRLLVIPDGELSRLPLAPLVLPDGRRLLDVLDLCHLASSHEILDEGSGRGEGTPPVVVGAPDFELAAEPSELIASMAATETTEGRAGEDVSEYTFSSVPAEMLRGDTRFASLAGTYTEAHVVGALLGVRPWTGGAALKGRLRRLQSPVILHIATHGFFLESKLAHLLEETGLEAYVAAEHAVEGRFSGGRLANAFLRSGLALAGANVWLRFEAPPPEAEDGLLTAEDISRMDLAGTRLAVLSACDTGLGDVRVGDGVMGLQRAFILAGAATIVMSLWRVPDLATCLLMEHFYDGILHRREACDRSLRNAQLAIRDLTLGELRERCRADVRIGRLAASLLHRNRTEPADFQPFLHAGYWGGFVCMGDWRPVDVLVEPAIVTN
jgi:CHAT domain-containing protein/tetratricopeptide (TPR) repeat protein